MATMQLRMLFQNEAVQECSRDVQDDALDYKSQMARGWPL